MSEKINPKPQTWDKVWRKEGFSDSNRTIQRAISKYFPDLRGINVLEVGCGRAGDAIALALRGASSYGVDFSSEALSLAKKTLTLEK